jgi:chemotaxis signal transduction protein
VALAPPPAGPQGPQKLVCFELAGQAFGLPIRAVKETLPMRPLTQVCLVSPVVAGLMNLRGEVVAVLDLARMVGLAQRAERSVAESAVVILRAPESWSGRAQERAACGLAVDRLLGVKDVNENSLRQPPPSLDAEAASYLRGVCAVGEPPAALAVLDPERVLGSEQLKPYRRQK